MAHPRLSGTFLLGALAATAGAADWPMYRADAARSAAIAEPLADTLHLQWKRRIPTRIAAFGTDRRNPVDAISVPVIAGGLVLIGNEADHALQAFALETGALRWTFVADGPFRFAPAVADGVVYAAADDGVLHALELASGSERWRYVGAPSPRKIINHGHVTSAWPTSGGPAVRDGTVYFSTGILPIDGTWMHAVDAKTGERRWRVPAEVCWGYTAVIGDWVVVPSGMFPNVFNAATGAKVRSAWSVKNLSPNRIIGFTADYLWNGNEIISLSPGRQNFGSQYVNAEHNANMWSPVIDGDRAYGFNDGILRGLRLPGRDDAAAEVTSGKGQKQRGLIKVLGEYWLGGRPGLSWSQIGEELPLPAGTSLPKVQAQKKEEASIGIGWSGGEQADGAGPWYPRRLELKAGPMLIAAGPQALAGIKLGPDGAAPKVTFILPVEGNRQELAAADGRLVAVCDNGAVLCFGPNAGTPKDIPLVTAKAPDAAASTLAGEIVTAAGPVAQDGYVAVVGDRDGSLGEALSASCPRMVTVLEADQARSATIRSRLAAAGRLDRQLGVIEGTLATAQLPPYAFNLLVVTEGAAAVVSDPANLSAAYAALRPYGGTACLALDDAAHKRLETAAAALPKATVARNGRWSLLRRTGALVGSDDWTHERHGPGNTLRSSDVAITAPMGMLWLGGPSTEWQTRLICDGLYQAVEVVEGRYVMLGKGMLSAIDAYTGRLMWETKLPTAQRYVSYIEVKKGPDGKPVYPEPGSGLWQGNHAGLAPGEIEVARQCGDGYNVVSMADEIYVTIAEDLWVVSTTTGSVVRKMPLPVRDPAAGRPLCWGTVRVVGDTIVATAFDPARWRAIFPVWAQGNDKNKQQLPATWIFAADRRTGALRWQQRAEQGFESWGVACGNGRVYALDLIIPSVKTKAPEVTIANPGSAPTVIGLDLVSGKLLWRKPVDPLVIDIAYSAERDLVVLPSRENYGWRDGGWVLDQPPPPTGGKPAPKSSVMRAIRGADGEQIWRIEDDEFAEPVVINGEVVITRRGRGYELASGKRAMRNDPVTGNPEPVDVSTGGCNFLIASPEFTTHRTCYDVWSVGCTMPFDGIRSGCTPSMLPANGLISVINQAMEENTELRSNGAMVSRPDNVNWTSFSGKDGNVLAVLAQRPTSIPRLALDLGAPSDHLGKDGTAWVRLGPDRASSTKNKAVPSIVRFPGDGVSGFVLPVPGLPAKLGGQPIVASTGSEGLSELAIRLVPPGQPAQRYRVRLHLLEPSDRAKAGERVFSIALQGKDVVTDLDLVREAGPCTALVRDVAGVEVPGELSISLRAKTGKTVLCGVEMILEPAAN